MDISSPAIWLAGKPRTIEPWCVTVKKKKEKKADALSISASNTHAHMHTHTMQDTDLTHIRHTQVAHK